MAAGSDPGRAHVALMRGHAYLQAANADQAWKVGACSLISLMHLDGKTDTSDHSRAARGQRITLTWSRPAGNASEPCNILVPKLVAQAAEFGCGTTYHTTVMFNAPHVATDQAGRVQDSSVVLSYGPQQDGACTSAHAHALHALAWEGLKVTAHMLFSQPHHLSETQSRIYSSSDK